MVKLRQVASTGGLYKATDVEKPILLTIASGEEEEVGQQKELKWVIRFREKGSKGLANNGERAEQFFVEFGTDDIDELLGRQVVLFQGTTKYQGKTVPCVSVRAPKGKAAASQKTDAHDAAGHQQQQSSTDIPDDEIPF